MLTPTTSRVRRRGNAGTSLAELLVASFLGLTLLGVAAGFFVTQQRTLLIQDAYAESQNVTRTFSDLFAREVRMASYDPTGTAMPTLSPGPTCPGITQGIVQATPTTFEFKQDLNGNGVTTDSGEDVIYTLTGTQITRQDGAAAAVPLVDGVPTGGLTFQYYDCNNAELVPGGSPAQLSTDYRACICKVRVTLTAQLADPQFVNIQPLISAVQTEVAVRNRSITNTSF